MHRAQVVAMAKALRSLTTRPLTRAAFVTGLLSLLGLAHAEEAGAGKSNKCKPDCKECQFCQKGNCKKNKHGKKSCKPGKCKNLTNGSVCTKPSGGVCQAGQCACTGGATNCAGICRNLQTDVANCGACGNACLAGQTCCSGSCKNLQSDPANCASCGNVCAAPTVLCVASKCCRPPNTPCAVVGADLTCCTNVCLPANMVIPFNHCA